MKTCRKCGVSKPATAENFYKGSGRCKLCHIKDSTESNRARRSKEGDKPYYVYEWYFVDSGKPFYVGKGRGRRYLEKKDRSKVFRNYVAKFNCASRKIFSGLSDEEAYAKEIEVIKNYRAIGINLINKTDGGDNPPVLKGLRSPNRREVIQLSLDGKFVRRWIVIHDAEKELGISNTLIVKSCKSGGKSAAGGFLWVYAEEYDPDLGYLYKRKTVAKPILQYRLDGTLVKEWESAKQAAENLGLHRGPLCSCLKGVYHTCGGFIWKYKNDYEENGAGRSFFRAEGVV